MLEHYVFLRGQLFRERPTELIERLKTAYPLIDNLFVSAEYLSAAEAEIKQKGTLRYKAFLQSMEKKELPPVLVDKAAIKVAADKIVEDVVKKAGAKK